MPVMPVISAFHLFSPSILFRAVTQRCHPQRRSIRFKERLRQVAEVPDLLELIITVFGDSVRKYMIYAGLDDVETLKEVFYRLGGVGVGYRAASLCLE